MKFTLSGPSRKRQRVVLTNTQKQAIILYEDKHPKASLENIAEAIRRNYHLSATPETSTIGDVLLANKEKWKTLKMPVQLLARTLAPTPNWKQHS